MSMYEIENLMENTVRLIDKSAALPSDKRNQIWNAYHLQNQFDCSFTHFRLMDVLLKNEFVQHYAIQDFPMYGDYPDFFNQLASKKFEWIRENPTEAYSDTNLEIAYWDKKSERIYADFGSAHYNKFPTETAAEIPPLDFAMAVITLANTHKDKGIVYDWTAFMLIYLFDFFPENATESGLKEQYFTNIKTIFNQFDYTEHEVLHEGLDLKENKNASWLSAVQQQLINYILD